MRAVRVGDGVHSGPGPAARLQPTEHQHGLAAGLRNTDRRPLSLARGRP